MVDGTSPHKGVTSDEFSMRCERGMECASRGRRPWPSFMFGQITFHRTRSQGGDLAGQAHIGVPPRSNDPARVRHCLVTAYLHDGDLAMQANGERSICFYSLWGDAPPNCLARTSRPQPACLPSSSSVLGDGASSPG